MNSTRSTTLAIGVALALGIPAGAHADTYCVNGPCHGGTDAQTHSTLSQALADAAGSSGSDTIEIGPGTLTNVNLAESNSDEGVEIVGAGRGATRLVGGAGNNTPVLRLNQYISSVSDLTIQMGSGASGGGLDLVKGRGREIDVESAPAPNPTTSGVGVTVGSGAGLTYAKVALNDSAAAKLTGVRVSANAMAESVVEELDIAAWTGLEAMGPGVVTAHTLNVHDTAEGVVSRGGRLGVSSSLIRASRGSAPVAAQARSSGGKASISVHGVTAIGPQNAAGSVGVGSVASLPNSQAAAEVRDSIIQGFGKSLSRVGSLGPAELSASYSDYDPATADQLGGGVLATGVGNVNVNPGFAGPGDYRLAPSSPLIDAGDPNGPTAGDSAVALGSTFRLADGNGDGVARTDLGAFEYHVPQAGGGGDQGDIGGVGGGGAGGGGGGARVIAQDLVRPVIGRLSRSGSSVRFRLSEPGSVRMTLARRTKGKRGKAAFRTVRTIAARGKAGENRITLPTKKLAAGSYRVTITVADAAGNRSLAKSLTFTWRRPK